MEASQHCFTLWICRATVKAMEATNNAEEDGAMRGKDKIP